MVGLALVVTWGGYLLFSYGFALSKGLDLTVSDLALPSHRAKVVSAYVGLGAK